MPLSKAFVVSNSISFGRFVDSVILAAESVDRRSSNDEARNAAAPPDVLPVSSVLVVFGSKSHGIFVDGTPVDAIIPTEELQTVLVAMVDAGGADLANVATTARTQSWRTRALSLSFGRSLHQLVQEEC